MSINTNFTKFSYFIAISASIMLAILLIAFVISRFIHFSFSISSNQKYSRIHIPFYKISL